MMMKLTSATLLALALTGGAVEAFVTPSPATTTASTTVATTVATTTTTTTQLYGGPGDTATKDIPYGETSRQFRRTVYTHEDWVKHRSPNRFVKNIFSIVASGIYKVRTIHTVQYSTLFLLYALFDTL